jgi:hypothetical protein
MSNPVISEQDKGSVRLGKGLLKANRCESEGGQFVIHFRLQQSG